MCCVGNATTRSEPRSRRSLAPSAAALFYFMPVAGRGTLGRELGELTPVVVVLANARWGWALGRLLGPDVGIGATCVQVPSFLGQASVLSVETLRPIDVKQAEDWLASAPGVHVWTQDAEGPSMRASAGHREALVGRVRRDESTENALSLWISADVIALAAANAVDLAVARLQLS